MKETSNINLLSTKAPKGSYLLAKTRNKNVGITTFGFSRKNEMHECYKMMAKKIGQCFMWSW